MIARDWPGCDCGWMPPGDMGHDEWHWMWVAGAGDDTEAPHPSSSDGAPSGAEGFNPPTESLARSASTVYANVNEP